MSASEVLEPIPIVVTPDESGLVGHIAYLRSLGADQMQHSGRAFIEHLTGTYDLLKAWACDESVALAGLYHSIYGTNVFEHSTLSFEQRGELRARIGDRAEQLAFIFCSVERPKAFLSALRTRKLANRFSNAQITVDAKTLRDLVCIECANLIEQRGNRGFLSSLMAMPDAAKLALPAALKSAVNQYVQGVGLGAPIIAPVVRRPDSPAEALALPAPRNTASLIRPASDADVVELVYLARELHADSRWQWTHFDKGRAAQQIRDWLTNKDCQLIVAQKGADIVGFTAVRQEHLLFTNSKIARVHFLYVQHRARGVLALRLLHAAVAWSRHKQVAELRLEDQIGVNIERNQRLFERLALKRVGTSLAVWL